MRVRGLVGRTPWRGTAAVASCLALAACSSTSSSSPATPTPSPSATTSSPPTESPSPSSTPDAAVHTLFRVAAATQLPGTPVFGVDLHGSRVLTLTPKAVLVSRLPSLESAYAVRARKTAVWRTLWSDPHGSTSYVVSTRSVAGTGTRVGHDNVTLQAFDTQTGKRRKPVVARIRKDVNAPEGPQTARVVGKVGKVVVVETWLPGPAYPARSLSGVDAHTGKIIWQQRPARAVTLQDGVLIALASDGSTAGPVEAIRVSTGRKDWETTAKSVSALLVGLTPRSVLVSQVGTLGLASLVRLDLRTGEPLGQSLLPQAPTFCTQANPATSLCNGPDHTLTAWNLGTAKVRWSLPSKRRYAPTVTSTHAGIAYGTLTSGRAVALKVSDGSDVRDPGIAPLVVGNLGGLILAQGHARFVPFTKPLKR